MSNTNPAQSWPARIPVDDTCDHRLVLSEDTDVLLILLADGDRGLVEFPLELGASLTVGRHPHAQLRINHESISRMHAAVKRSDTGITVTDLGSKNGVFINGQKVDREEMPVQLGDCIRFGAVNAQLAAAHRRAASFDVEFLDARQFNERLRSEADRCVRAESSMVVLSIQTPADPETVTRARIITCATLRLDDFGTVQFPGQIDLVLGSCSRAESLRVAETLRERLMTLHGDIRLGLAAYPDDAPSPDSILLAARLALQDATADRVGLAKAGSRVMRIGAREVVLCDPSMIRLFALIDRVAWTTLPALVAGETGSGKEIIAEAIHMLGPRAGEPLVKINCAAIPAQLIESELFGYARGAFSGADRDKPGLFEQAHGGTLVLDEIGDMPAPLQAKLLRVVEDRRVRRLGSNEEREVDVRIVACTHRDLQSAAAAGSFRQDLFYRLSGMVLKVPPLRNRTREIPLLAERFASDLCESSGRPRAVLSADVIQLLQQHDWPGNIRELRNVVSAAVMMCDGAVVELQHVPPLASRQDDSSWYATEPVTQQEHVALTEEIEALERQRIGDALRQCGGNQTKAAGLLGMPRRTLVSKLSRLGLTDAAASQRRA